MDFFSFQKLFSSDFSRKKFLLCCKLIQEKLNLSYCMFMQSEVNWRNMKTNDFGSFKDIYSKRNSKFFKVLLGELFFSPRERAKKIKKMCSHSKRCTFLQNVRPSELGHFLLYNQTHVVGCWYGITLMTMPDPIHSKLHTYFYYYEHCIDGTAGITRSGHSIISGSFYPSTLLLKYPENCCLPLAAI